MSYALRPTSYVLCPMPYVLRPTSYVLCPKSYVLCRMSYVLCPNLMWSKLVQICLQWSKVVQSGPMLIPEHIGLHCLSVKP